VRRGPDAGLQFAITEPMVTVGRHRSCDIQVNDPEVSRQHARITWSGTGYAVEDLGSINGTFVNGERISAPRALKNGDLLRLGKVELALQVAEPVPADEMPTMAGVAAPPAREPVAPPARVPPPEPLPVRAPPPEPLPAREKGFPWLAVVLGALALLCLCLALAGGGYWLWQRGQHLPGTPPGPGGVPPRPTAATGAASPAPPGATISVPEALPTTVAPPPAGGPGATYYVAPGGDDANPGTRDAPWATPGYGSRQLQPGDTLLILGGLYTLSRYDEDIVTPPSGTADAWIAIKGEEGSRPILAGRDDLPTAIDLSGVSYVRVENLEITHDPQASGETLYFREGVEILEAPSSHIVLQDLYIHHIDEFGLNVQDVEDLQVLNCQIEYCGFGAMGGPTGAAGGWRNVRVQGCSLSYGGHYYQGGDGSNRPYDRPDGFGIESSAGPIEIADTTAEHNYGDGLDSKAANTTIRRCIVANNSCDGVKLWGDNSRVENTLIYGRGDGNPEPTPWSSIVIGTETANARFEIVNVTVDDALGQNYIMHVQYDTPDLPVQLTLRNSIFRGVGPDSSISIGQATTLAADYNLFYLPKSDSVLTHGDTTYTAETVGDLGPGNRYGDPGFVAPAWGKEGDYHLQKGSPAIDAGTSEGAPSDDAEGRPRSAEIDIGAYEAY
jgi:pSer/pThr/pTyr-binding forkhead associated (FHA) protein